MSITAAGVAAPNSANSEDAIISLRIFTCFTRFANIWILGFILRGIPVPDKPAPHKPRNRESLHHAIARNTVQWHPPTGSRGKTASHPPRRQHRPQKGTIMPKIPRQTAAALRQIADHWESKVYRCALAALNLAIFGITPNETRRRSPRTPAPAPTKSNAASSTTATPANRTPGKPP